MRDNDFNFYFGKSVHNAVKNVNTLISQELIGMDSSNQSDIDNSGQRLFVSNDISGRIAANNTTIVKLGGAGGVYTTGGSKHSTTPATFQLNSDDNMIATDYYGKTGEASFDNDTST